MGAEVRWVRLQANYFCRRKFLLVNGTHTTLAFMTLCMKQPHSDEPGDFPLIDWDVKSCGQKYYDEIWAWVRFLASSSSRGK
jgi:hypothetical protein